MKLEIDTSNNNNHLPSHEKKIIKKINKEYTKKYKRTRSKSYINKNGT